MVVLPFIIELYNVAVGSGGIGVSVGGERQLRIIDGQVLFDNGALIAGNGSSITGSGNANFSAFRVSGSGGTVSAPAISFEADITSGIWWSGNGISISVGGERQLRIIDGQVLFDNGALIAGNGSSITGSGNANFSAFRVSGRIVTGKQIGRAHV